MTADSFTVYEDLRRGRDIVLGLERISFFTRRQPVVLDREFPTLQKIERLEAIGANVMRHDHSVDDGGLGRCDLLNACGNRGLGHRVFLLVCNVTRPI